MEEEVKKKKGKGKIIAIVILILVVIAVVVVAGLFYSGVLGKKDEEEETSKSTSKTKEQGETEEQETESEYAVTDNNLSRFDLEFLKLENEDKNKIYSPLSIKYAFKMLSEASSGKTKDQIDSIIKAYNLTEYESNDNMALANAFFINNDYKSHIKESYVNALKTKYNADVIYDDFTSASTINSWVKEHTLNLIPEVMQDSDVQGSNFALVNALGIDMDWNHKFLEQNYPDDANIKSYEAYPHERLEGEKYGFEWAYEPQLYKTKFSNGDDVSSMEVIASFNKYDIISEFGEDKIHDTVLADFKNWVNEDSSMADSYLNGDHSDSAVESLFNDWYNGTGEWSGAGSYIDAIKTNYNTNGYSTDFEFYVDDDVKVFAKDLKEYNGTTLQYIGIMPENEELSEFVENTTLDDVNNYIGNLKELKADNFEDGYLTLVYGTIPKFTFDYELSLMDDLKEMGVTDVFDEKKADLSKMTDEKNAYIDTLKHKATIEFTQDGIKAAATTAAGGLGAGDFYDYFFEVPTKKIDITFNKPYMFLIRDKKTGETWFVGTVYEPLEASQDNSTGSEIYNYAPYSDEYKAQFNH